MLEPAGIDHLVLRTENLAAMLRFYRDVLGCVLERQVPDLGLYQLRAGRSLIDLVPVDGPLGRRGGGPPTGPARLDHLCLQLRAFDPERTTRWLADNGCEAEPPETRYGAGGFGPSIYLRDPDGNTVELRAEPAAAAEGSR